MIKKSFELSVIKEAKGKIEVNFKEITKVSNYIKTESTSLLTSVLEAKLVSSKEVGKENIESQTGGSNE
jgi:hypothetical protein